MNKTKAVVFDMDGVIFDTQKQYNACFREMGKRYGISDGKMEELILKTMGVNETESYQVVEELLGGTVSGKEFVTGMLDLFKAGVEAEGLPLKPGVKELLSWLHEHGFLVGLASATDYERIVKYLTRAGLKQYFSFITGGDRVEHGKPAPDIYLQACENMGADPKETYGVEDSFQGIRAVHNAGMHVVMVPDSLEPTPEIESLLDFRFETLFGFLDYLKGAELELPEED